MKNEVCHQARARYPLFVRKERYRTLLLFFAYEKDFTSFLNTSVAHRSRTISTCPRASSSFCSHRFISSMFISRLLLPPASGHTSSANLDRLSTTIISAD